MHIKSSRTAFTCPLFKVEERQVVVRDGKEQTFWVVVRPPNVAAVALTNDKRIVLIKEIIGKDDVKVLGLPSGKMEKYTPTEQELKRHMLRELKEETGFSAKRIELLSKQTPPSNWYERDFYKFAAWDLEEGEQHLEPGERITPHLVTVQEAEKMARERKTTFPFEAETILRALDFFRKRKLL